MQYEKHDNLFTGPGNDMLYKIHTSVSITSLKNSRTHSYIFVYGYFCAMTAKLSSCNRNHLALQTLNYLLSGPLLPDNFADL